MSVLAWLQSDERVWKIVSDIDEGTIRVYDEKGNIIFVRHKLSREAIALIEEDFIKVGASNLSSTEPETLEDQKAPPYKKYDNAMYR